jgi:hypothetical protein
MEEVLSNINDCTCFYSSIFYLFSGWRQRKPATERSVSPSFNVSHLPRHQLSVVFIHTKDYTECLAFSSVVQIGYPRPLPASECCSAPPPLWVQGGDTLACWGPNSDEGKQTLWYSMYNLIPVRHTLSSIYTDDILGYRNWFWRKKNFKRLYFLNKTAHLSSNKRKNQSFNNYFRNT